MVSTLTLGTVFATVLVLASSALAFTVLSGESSPTDPPPFVLVGNSLKAPLPEDEQDSLSDSRVVVDYTAMLSFTGMIKTWQIAGQSSGANDSAAYITFVLFRPLDGVTTPTNRVYQVNCTNTFAMSSAQAIAGFHPPETFHQWNAPLNAQCFGAEGDLVGFRTHGSGHVHVFRRNSALVGARFGFVENVDLDSVSTIDFSTDGEDGSAIYSVRAGHYIGTVPEVSCFGEREPTACNGAAGECVGFDNCDCNDGYDGTECEIDIDGCASPTTTCFPGVDCVDVPAPGTGNTCGACPSGMEGDGVTCTEIDGCSVENNPCFGGSTCTDNPAPATGATCSDCDDGYTGPLCADNLDACDSDPCFPDVTCVDHAPPSLGFSCGACPPGFEGNGVNCTDTDGCSGDPCYPGVTCTDVSAPEDGFTCGACPLEAPIGDGITCRPNCFGEMNDSLVCSGHGTCVGENECGCDPGWDGSHCDVFVGFSCSVPDPSDINSCASNCAYRQECLYCCSEDNYATPGYHFACRKACHAAHPLFWDES